MHNNFRLQQLLQFLEEQPNDAFTLYAIALEYLKTDSLKALEYFEKLHVEQPDYVPTYYHLAKLYEDLEEREKARMVYEEGLSVAKKMEDAFAYRELERAYQQFLLEED